MNIKPLGRLGFAVLMSIAIVMIFLTPALPARQQVDV